MMLMSPEIVFSSREPVGPSASTRVARSVISGPPEPWVAPAASTLALAAGHAASARPTSSAADVRPNVV